jgi:hypothetical protein
MLTFSYIATSNRDGWLGDSVSSALLSSFWRLCVGCEIDFWRFSGGFDSGVTCESRLGPAAIPAVYRGCWVDRKVDKVSVLAVGGILNNKSPNLRLFGSMEPEM